MTITRWLVQSGPNNSHLWDNQFHDRKRDAVAAAESLPLTPNGQVRPYIIWRMRYQAVNSVFDKVDHSMVVDGRTQELVT